MKQAIWKFPLAITDRQQVVMPRHAVILCCQVQDGSPCLWAMCDTEEAEKPPRCIEILGTGHPVDECNRGYIDTFQLENGQLVFHVFERYEPTTADNQGAARVEAELAKPDANLAGLESRMDAEDNQGVPVAHSDATARKCDSV